MSLVTNPTPDYCLSRYILLVAIYFMQNINFHTFNAQPTLDRKAVKRQDDNPEEGEGSEFGKKRREEVRKRKRGYNIRRANPDDQPWVLKERKREGKQ